ncbi:MAG: GyrI-like domain-containing protein, partial [Deltaproteobacteria bacterium]|nr:GyrI-like domain-containing protein [Deltaproteobacteria bacterium]
CLFIRRKVKREEIKDFFGEALPKVFAHMTANGIAPGGPPFARYLDCPEEDGGFLVEAGLPTLAPADAAGEIETGELVGGKALVYVHAGPYEKLGEAWSAGDKQMEAQHLTKRDAPYEVYETDPREVPDPAEWRTRIIRPLE